MFFLSPCRKNLFTLTGGPSNSGLSVPCPRWGILLGSRVIACRWISFLWFWCKRRNSLRSQELKTNNKHQSTLNHKQEFQLISQLLKLSQRKMISSLCSIIKWGEGDFSIDVFFKYEWENSKKVNGFVWSYRLHPIRIANNLTNFGLLALWLFSTSTFYIPQKIHYNYFLHLAKKKMYVTQLF